MFGLFKKKEAAPAPSRIVRLMQIYEDLSVQADGLYDGVERYNPAEVRFFTMSAMSIFIQSHCKLPEGEMQAVVNAFTEQAIADLIFKMPRASYDLLHDAFVERFGEYVDPIVDVSNAEDGQRLSTSLYVLMTAIDERAGVDRDAVSRMGPGMNAYKALNAAETEVFEAFKA